MRWISWCLFTLQNGVLVIFSLGKMLWIGGGEALFILGVFLFVLSLSFVTYPARSSRAIEKIIPAPVAKIHFWQKWEQAQPTHRDILLNLSTLYRETDRKRSEQFLQQVREIDPNFVE